MDLQWKEKVALMLQLSIPSVIVKQVGRFLIVALHDFPDENGILESVSYTHLRAHET